MKNQRCVLEPVLNKLFNTQIVKTKTKKITYYRPNMQSFFFFNLLINLKYDDDAGFGWSLGPTLVLSFRYTTKLCSLMR
jgi:hypothetical protein